MIVRLVAALLASLLTAAAPPAASFPAAPPAATPVRTADARIIRLHIEYDEHFAAQHGEEVEDFIRKAVAIHAIEWRRYRNEWFEVESLRMRPSGDVRDGTYVLASFLNRTVAAPDRLHLAIVGRQLEVYTSGTRAVAVGGLAYRGTDAALVSPGRGASAELVAYYMFHEIGHCFDARDLPFRGGESTFGNKSGPTFDIDAGNAEIVDESPGPRPRDTRDRAPMILRRRLAHARSLGLGPHLYRRLHDLMLHETSPANPAYVRKRAALLADAGTHRARITALLRQYEITPGHFAEDQELRARISAHYWRANEALRKRDYETASAELAAIRAAEDRSPDIHLLVSAVERKIRRRR